MNRSLIPITLALAIIGAPQLAAADPAAETETVVRCTAQEIIRGKCGVKVTVTDPVDEEARQKAAKAEKDAAEARQKAEEAARQTAALQQQIAAMAPPKPAPAGPPASVPVNTRGPRMRATTPVYKKWWFWTAIGGAVVAGAGTAVIVSEARKGFDPAGLN